MMMMHCAVKITVVWILIVINQINPTHSIHREAAFVYNLPSSSCDSNNNCDHIPLCDQSHRTYNGDSYTPTHGQLNSTASRDCNSLSKEDIIVPIKTIETNKLYDDKVPNGLAYNVGVDPSSSVIIDVISTSGSSDGNGPSDDPDNSQSENNSASNTTTVIDTSSETTSSDADDNDYHFYPKVPSLKDIWSKFIESPPSTIKLKTLLSKSSSQVIAATVNNPLQANGTNMESLYKQFLVQFLDPLASNNRRSIWLDQEFALSLKGSATLAQHPELIVNITGPLVPKINRALKISSSKDDSDGPTGVCVIQETMVKALAHSLNANLLHLNLNTVDKVRNTAILNQATSTTSNVDDGSMGSIHSYSTSSILTALIEAVYDCEQPTVVLINDDLEWLTHDEEASGVMLSAIKSKTLASSKLLFIAIEPDEALKVGQPAPSCKPTSPASTAASAVDESPSTGTSSPFSFSNIFGSPNPSTVQPTKSMPQAADPSGSASFSNAPPGFGFPFPPPPPGMMGPTMGRSFQVVVQNGTATMIPLPPGVVPPNFLPGAPPPNTPEGQHLMRNFIMDQQRAFQQQMGQNNSFSFPLFPPGMSEEDIQEFMQDPENQGKIKGVIDSVMQSLSQQISEEASSFFNPYGKGPNNVEVKVHMVGMPAGKGGFSGLFQPAGVKPGSPTPSAATTNGDKNGSSKKNSRLPGSFFKGLKPKKDKGPEAKQLDSEGAHSNTTTALIRRSQEVPTQCSDTGHAVIASFDHFVLEPPRDHNLKILWDRLIDEEISSRILRTNRRLIQQELRRAHLKHTSGALRALSDILRRQLLSREDIKQALTMAMRLQAGRQVLIPPQEAQNTNAKEDDSKATATVEASSTLSDDDIDSVPTSSVRVTDASSASSLSLMKRVHLVPMVLSYWAMDSAFCSLLKVPSSRLGKPVIRDKNELANLPLDKHEKALVSNVISPQDIGVTYSMIGGLDEVKEQLRQCITYPLKYPRLYQEGVAAEAVKGVLLFGPPGTGKTMLAKAVATEGGATFLAIDASTIENKWLGESEKNAKAVFALARKLAPCVVYLDEVDSILSSREQGDESSHGTLTSVKTTLMQEWDGLRTTKDRVVVIASTNRPFDLDEAVLRRLPRRIMVDLPDLSTRADILAVTLANNRVAPDVNLTTLAEQLEGYTGSDIKEVCREAVVRIAHERAMVLENGLEVLDSITHSGRRNDSVESSTDAWGDSSSSSSSSRGENEVDVNAALRPVTLRDFKLSMLKLKSSVNDNGKEMQKVVEWNSKYGEIKRKKRPVFSQATSIYV